MLYGAQLTWYVVRWELSNLNHAGIPDGWTLHAAGFCEEK